MAEPMRNSEWVPMDTFGARLALVRQAMGGWNVKKAADFCGVDDQSWRNWEAGKRPRDYAEECRKIARATGVDYTWLMVGGQLSASGYMRNDRALSLIAGTLPVGQQELHFAPPLALV